MKKVIIAITLFLATLNTVNAQQVQIQDTPPNWSLMLSNIGTSQITSGVLYNKVIDFSKLKNLKMEKNFQDSS